MCIPRATVSAVSCLVVPAFICIDLLISRVLKINDDDDKFGQLILRKIIEIVATRSHILGYNTPNSLLTGAPPQTPLGELTALPQPPPLAGF